MNIWEEKIERRKKCTERETKRLYYVASKTDSFHRSPLKS